MRREQYAREVVGGLLKNYYDLLRSHALGSADLERMTDVEGAENMQRALERGNGVIAVMPHLGNFSLVAEPMTARLGRPITVAVEQMSNQAAHDLINTLRRRPHITVVEVGPNVTRTLIRALRRGEIVVLFGDRAVAEGTVEVPFFGTCTAVPAGAATLALRLRVPLLTAYTYRQADHRSMVVIDPPLALERMGTLVDDVRRATAAIMRVLAAYIRRYPGQWLMTERVWTTP
jgi:lauroyl/myristoyl acyltransferase